MKHYFILSVIFIFIGQVSLSQTIKNPKFLIDAKKVYDSGNYFEAINKCEKTYKKLGTRGSIKDKGEVAFILAECYRRLEKYEKANDWYERCIELKYFDINPEIYFLKGNMLKMTGDFTNAIKAYESYKKYAPNSMSVKIEDALKSCRDYMDINTRESNYITKSESLINSKEFDHPHSFLCI